MRRDLSVRLKQRLAPAGYLSFQGRGHQRFGFGIRWLGRPLRYVGGHESGQSLQLGKLLDRRPDQAHQPTRTQFNSNGHCLRDTPRGVRSSEI